MLTQQSSFSLHWSRVINQLDANHFFNFIVSKFISCLQALLGHCVSRETVKARHGTATANTTTGPSTAEQSRGAAASNGHGRQRQLPAAASAPAGAGGELQQLRHREHGRRLRGRAAAVAPAQQRLLRGPAPLRRRRRRPRERGAPAAAEEAHHEHHLPDRYRRRQRLPHRELGLRVGILVSRVLFLLSFFPHLEYYFSSCLLSSLWFFFSLYGSILKKERIFSPSLLK